MTDLRFAPVDPVGKTPLKRGFEFARKSLKAAEAGNRSQELKDSPNADRLKLRTFSFSDPEA